MNRIVLIGNLTRDPELKYTPNGLPVTTFGIAVNRYTKNAQGEKDVDFFNCVAWRQRAEFISQYAQKGTKIAIEGQMHSRSYVAQDGVKKTVWEVVVDSSDLLDRARDAAGGAVPPEGRSADSAVPPAMSDDDFADPFGEG